MLLDIVVKVGKVLDLKKKDQQNLLYSMYSHIVCV